MTRLRKHPVMDVEEIASRQLCLGCGACAYLRPDSIRMVDVLDHGRRPVARPGAERDALVEAVRVCPGAELAHRADEDEEILRELRPGWGPVLELAEGFAKDPEIRFAGSSGGATTALALYCIERGGMEGVLHTAARQDAPYLNRTVFSRTRAELLAATGSRYAPASPCEGLGQIEDASGPCVFIGKPCDVAGAELSRRSRRRLDHRLGLTIGFFCAGTPSVRGTLEMLRAMGVEELSTLEGLRYRGNGWPGDAVAAVRTETGREERRLSYEQSWGDILQRHRQWRCYVCADHTGEFADIAVGDPWYREIAPDEPGRSLVLARTPHGRRVIHAAVEAGYLELQPVVPGVLPASQPNLLRSRGAIWGRILASRMMGARAPRFRRMPTLRFWWSELGAWAKVQSLVGTVRRVVRRGLRRSVDLVPFVPEGAEADERELSFVRDLCSLDDEPEPDRTPPDVSILIVSYNTRELTLDCLRSVYAETADLDFEIIVVDCASEDGSADAIEAGFPGVRVVRESTNIGFGAACNLGARSARATYILLLNPDTVVVDGAIQKSLRFMSEHPEVGAAGARTVYGDGSLNPTSCFALPSLWGMLCQATGLSVLARASNLFNHEAMGGWERDSLREVGAVTGCYLMIPRSLWLRLGGFDEQFFMYSEDTDLSLRVRRAGYRCFLNPDATIVHYGGRSDSVRAEKVVKLQVSKVLFMRKHWSPFAAGVGIVLLDLGVCARVAAHALRVRFGADRTGLELWRAAWRGRSKWRNARR